ncbi:hypothetical protein ONZ45_g17716 [Pleurotus djamor]|nr:hypothetical protein ONZ45_g17716 [Pleurotus djamor]
MSTPESGEPELVALASPSTGEMRKQRAPLLGQLSQFELFWRENFDWLTENGYRLRSRYHPDWKPAWKVTNKPFYECSDGLQSHYPTIVDAERISDGELLLLKRVDKRVHPYEAEIGRFFSTGSLAMDPRNHCVPIYQVLPASTGRDFLILVMPLLKDYDEPPFDTIGEAVEFFRQIFEGLQFMHENNVAHRDATHFNILMDARHLSSHRYHPFQPSSRLDMNGRSTFATRTSKPVRYYLADFGLSRRYRAEDRPPTEDVIVGGDKSVPEFETMDACDPFPTDVYTIGNLIRRHFTEGSDFARKKLGFDFMEPLVADMTHPEPSKRPSMDEVVERFNEIQGSLGSWTLRSRVIRANEFYVAGVARTVSHWIRRLSYIAKNVPPIPRPD